MSTKLEVWRKDNYFTVFDVKVHDPCSDKIMIHFLKRSTLKDKKNCIFGVVSVCFTFFDIVSSQQF